MRTLKVCVVTQQLNRVISGPGLYSNLLVQSLIEQGHQVWVVAPHSQKPEQIKGFTFIGVAEPMFGGSQARWFSLGWMFRLALTGLARSVSVDLFHFTDAREAIFCRHIHPKIGNVNDTYSAELHGLFYYRRHYSDWLLRWGYYRIVHWLESWIYPNFERIIANSEFTSKTILNAYHINSDKLSLCYKAVDISRFEEAFSQRKLTSIGAVILFIGTNMQRKGLPSLIQALPSIIEKYPKASVNVVGDDPIIPVMKELCSLLSVEDHVKFLGWRSQKDLPSIYAQATVFVLPALTESLGVVFLEAMAAGVPVIGTQVGGIPEIIRHGETGMLVPPDNPDELARAICSILEDASLADRLKQNAKKSLGRFDKKNMLECTYAIYSDVLGTEL